MAIVQNSVPCNGRFPTLVPYQYFIAGTAGAFSSLAAYFSAGGYYNGYYNYAFNIKAAVKAILRVTFLFYVGTA